MFAASPSSRPRSRTDGPTDVPVPSISLSTPPPSTPQYTNPFPPLKSTSPPPIDPLAATARSSQNVRGVIPELDEDLDMDLDPLDPLDPLSTSTSGMSSPPPCPYAPSRSLSDALNAEPPAPPSWAIPQYPQQQQPQQHERRRSRSRSLLQTMRSSLQLRSSAHSCTSANNGNGNSHEGGVGSSAPRSGRRSSLASIGSFCSSRDRSPSGYRSRSGSISASSSYFPSRRKGSVQLTESGPKPDTVGAAAVLPAVLLLGAELFTPSR